jgi:hypothetical protein
MAAMKKVVVFLQNAWSAKFAGRSWPRASWLVALSRSRSGQRLRHLTAAAGPLVEWHFDNTTRAVWRTPDSVEPANLAHMLGVVTVQVPSAVVCMGQQARQALGQLLAIPGNHTSLPVLYLPHPAYRVLTSALLRLAGELIQQGWEGERELRQGRPAAHTGT